MSRSEQSQLSAIVEGAGPATYTLPKEVTDAFAIYAAVKALQIPAPDPLDLDTAAARVVISVTAGKTTDVAAFAHLLTAANEGRQDAELAKTVLSQAIEQAGHTAVRVASDNIENIIENHLRPALAEVLDQARKAATALKGYGLDAHRIVSAPAATRAAYASLPELVARRSIILTARRTANLLGYRVAEHDEGNLFASFENPIVLFPVRAPSPSGAKIPGAPEDPTEHLLWTASEQCAAAKPWLPTIAQQDAAWMAQFGDLARRFNPNLAGVSVNGGGDN